METRRAGKKAIGPLEVTEGFEFCSPVLTQALSYWLMIKGDAPFPRRADLVPEKLVALWPHILMVDVIDDGTDYFIRLFGQYLVDSYGEQTGRLSSQARVPELVRERSKQLFDACVAHAGPVYAYWPESAARRRAHVDVEALCLPLSSDGRSLDRLMSLNVNSRRERKK
ncbi:PAS domain-containing protein [Pelagibius marinus]|uniref:PAS domain-containing protein n=1 Tax=Pelagibius marinus TaxID=2762760 RepID=UPI00187328BE|nr:PAS domain-containing protein [Pelagibius marinus]